jgi:hypothetical protein
MLDGLTSVGHKVLLGFSAPRCRLQFIQTAACLLLGFPAHRVLLALSGENVAQIKPFLFQRPSLAVTLFSSRYARIWVQIFKPLSLNSSKQKTNKKENE